MWGLCAEDFSGEDDVEVWPDCWPAVEFFAAVPPGAWHFKPDTTKAGVDGKPLTLCGGPVGIRPEAYREVRLALGITAAAWRQIYPDVCVLEAAAVETMRNG